MFSPNLEEEEVDKEIMIQVSDSNYPIEYLNHLNLYRDELEEFVWSFTEKYLASEIINQQLWILKSDPYFKKKNLTSDQAEWSGWEIQARTPSHDYLISVERRKFIPPTMNTFSDFILITKLPRSEIAEDKKEGELKDIFALNLAEQRELIDSLEPIIPINKIYKTIIQEKAN